MRLGILFSGGKDSTCALHKAAENHELACLISVFSENTESYMFHTANIGLVEFQAQALGLPLIKKPTLGRKEAELGDLEAALEAAKKTYGIEGIVSGALHSNYQKQRVGKICRNLSLKSLTPLWHCDINNYMREISSDYNVIITSVSAEGLTQEWLGRRIDDSCVKDLESLSKKLGLHIAGEGGEYETLVLDAPLFKKQLEISGIKEWKQDSGIYKIMNVKLVGK